jgi:hypothetical protein
MLALQNPFSSVQPNNNSNNDNTNNNILESVQPQSTTPTVIEDDGFYDNDLSLCDKNFLRKLGKMSKTIYKRLQILAALGELVRSGFSGFHESTYWPVMTGGDHPWWQGKQDKDLLLGVYKHGFGRYELIRDDVSLCFSGNVKFEGKEKLTKKKRQLLFEASLSNNNLGASPKSQTPRAKELPAFPAPKWLNQRFKHVIQQLTSSLSESRRDSYKYKKSFFFVIDSTYGGKTCSRGLE